jgi:enoyl-CoA hydratase/carnithine racemase
MSPFRASAPLTDTWEHFRFSVSDGIGTVTLDRPGKLNALTFEAYADLRDLLAELPHRGDTRVLVIRGKGRAFCSGGDVNEIIGATLAMSPDELLAFTRMSGEVIREMRDCPVPIIAAVHGMAAGAGAVIALAADFRVCTPAARFAFLFTKVGLSGGDMGAAYLLPRLVGLGHATRLLMLGDTVNAEEAERIGLVSLLAGKDTFDDEVGALAGRLASGPVQAYAQTKALLTREQDMSLSAAIELEAMTQALRRSGPAAEDLLPQDVRVAAVLRELAQGVQVDPAQRKRAHPVTAEYVVQVQARGGPARVLARFLVPAADRVDGVRAGQGEGVGGVRRQAHLLPRASGDGLAEPHPLRVGRVLDQAEQRRLRGDQAPPGLLLGHPVQAPAQRGPVLVEEGFQLHLERFAGHVVRRPPAWHRHHASIARPG